MDNPGGNRQRGGPGQRRQRPRMQKPPQNPQLFDDTSTQPPPYSQNPAPPLGYSMPDTQYGYPPANMQAPAGYDPNMQYGGTPQQYGGGPQVSAGTPQMFNDPMANMAMQYGQTLADQGKDIVHKNLEKYVSTSKLKYYFAVDTSYVAKKLGLLLFPYAHTDWSLSFNQDEPVAPRYDVNAPDLYIPVMAFVTYILLSGVALGTQERFSPEQLGMTASTALVWMFIEILVLLLTMYVLNIASDLKYLDLLSYCGYKYVGMIVILVGGLVFPSLGYYLALLWTSAALAFFLVRTLRSKVIPHSDPDSVTGGSKRRLYVLLIIALSQPVFMWWLTRYISA